ncbi:MAG TPA: hypothetical protein VEI03_07840 [Stellaceae bacterium]|nr:hypothetical protein [Stellaceae bacterium]
MGMGIAERGEEPAFDRIDLDRVIVDPDYRRRVMDQLRAEAARRSPPADLGPASASDHRD